MFTIEAILSQFFSLLKHVLSILLVTYSLQLLSLTKGATSENVLTKVFRLSLHSVESLTKKKEVHTSLLKLTKFVLKMVLMVTLKNAVWL